MVSDSLKIAFPPPALLSMRSVPSLEIVKGRSSIDSSSSSSGGGAILCLLLLSFGMADGAETGRLAHSLHIIPVRR